MTIDTNLLIAAPMLQDFLIDKNGTPMAGGTITCYHDNSRTTLKNWYYQSGAVAPYNYIPLPNPLTLSAAGTICDVNGVDTIPFFYPYLETNASEDDPYYIVIQNAAQTNQITRENFPYNRQKNAEIVNELNLNNYIVNNGFWRNIQPNTLNVTPYKSLSLTNQTNLIVAPSQHDGFRYPDITFLKNNTSGQDSVTFTPFPLVPVGSQQTILTNDITPEYYINHQCANTGSSEQQKCYQFPISLHVNTLANVNYTVTIQAQNLGGTTGGQNVITLNLFQDTGTGTTPPAPVVIETITLSSSWQKYTFTGVFPATTGLSLSSAGDDALYLQVQMPLNVQCNINFARPSIYLTTNTVPVNSFQTYDQVDSIINSPRTGDLRISLNNFYYYGWLPMNNGTIGNVNSNASTRNNTDSWPLFNLIWNNFKQFSSGTSNPIAPMYDSTGNILVAYSANAITDWNLNRQLTLSRIMGQVLLGTVPVSALLSPYTQTISSVGVSGGNLQFTVATGAALYVGQTISFISTGTYPGNIGSNFVYYVCNISGASFQVALTFSNAINGLATGGSTTTYTGTLTANLQPLSSQSGEYAHTQLLTELVNHNHPGSTVPFEKSAVVGSYSGVSTGNFADSVSPTAVSITAQGGGLPFNVTQPGAYFNMYIKL